MFIRRVVEEEEHREIVLLLFLLHLLLEWMVDIVDVTMGRNSKET